MYNKFKDNKIRIFYIFICLLIIFLCFYFQDKIIDINKNMLIFSYYASVATIIALIISIMEIFYNIKITKSIKEQSLFNLTRFKDSTGLSFAHECASYYDSCLNDLAAKKYPLLVANFTIAKKLHISLANHFMTDNDLQHFQNEKERLNSLEKKIIATRHTNASNPLGNAQIREIQEAILETKHSFESKYTFKKSES
ncbi:hypothetical protein [Proteus vulgaris]|uniref:Uncharacterized protein n=1 Tax=Proteus vulgaris TaxID=585 RepID=A0A6G6SKF2_PROVU|nr:hypothetical protein [Proteus vulgaris]QIF94887.1 hypothetical protein GTH24_13725 [Proteus vulgaris]WIF71169.1 hypothetical protein QN092_14450 [Proteus vulgaris]CRL62056.1 hypothetical protein BN1805_01563 [Proteus vulgaris]